MTSIDPIAPRTGIATTLVPRAALALFAATLFGSAFLLFAVQPMFTKLVLPRLGGAPAVWSVAMVVFQAALLAGYAYAHVLSRTLAPSRAAIVHLAVLAAAAVTLPIGIASGFETPPETGITLWLVGLIAASVGLPFVALSASAPLLQHWFAATDHPQAHNPYVLYAASNLGSFAALMAYPFAIEPLVTLGGQARLWSIGFGILAAFVALTACFAARGTVTADEVADGARPTLSQRLSWIVLAAIPAGLVVAVTAYITTDVAAAPFLWVLPLALYLLTFVAVFRERPWISHAIVLRAVPFVIAPLAVSLLGRDKFFWFAVIALNLVGFFVLALACHGELYRRRPAVARLTEFYLWTSLGGVIGGIFAGLLAPNIFNRTYEYPILITAALLVMPGLFAGGVRHFARQVWPGLALTALVAIPQFLFDVRLPINAQVVFLILLVLSTAAMLVMNRWPARTFGFVVAVFVLTDLWQPGVNRIESVRSFFGVHQVVETANEKFRLLFHGTTLHGAQRLLNDDGSPATGRPEPLTYYYFGGPISETIASVRQARGTLASVAAVGLGTGSLACHRRDGEQWTFFEIDPEVVRIARDPNRFRFLSGCAPGLPIVLGDARLTLAASSAQYDMIVLDAFSSDAIPVHLLTREAFAGYLSRLKPNGVIVAHISNRHLELSSVVAAVGAAEGLVAYGKTDDKANTMAVDYRANSRVVALARTPADLGDLPRKPGWREIAPDKVVWTDDFSDVLRVLIRTKFGG